MTAKDTNRPATCQVPGCDGTIAVYRHRASGLAACKACRTYYNRHGHFDRKRRIHKRDDCTCQGEGCDRTDVYKHKATQLWLCPACRTYYDRHQTFHRTRRIHSVENVICSVCRTRKATRFSLYGKKSKPRCTRCYDFRRHNKKERPRHLRQKQCLNCGRNTSGMSSNNYQTCYLCMSYKWRNGHLPSPEHIAKYAPHGWCECGKPATKQIDLRTGALYVHPTLTGSSDQIRAEVQEWAEWMCDDCAGLEEEMQNIDASDYTPTSMIRRA